MVLARKMQALLAIWYIVAPPRIVLKGVDPLRPADHFGDCEPVESTYPIIGILFFL